MGGGLRRLGGLAFLAIVILWVARDPIGASHTATGIGHLATELADSLGTIANNVFH